MKIAIIGGGVSGLSLASYLQSKKIDFILIEKEGQLGGNAHTRTMVHNNKEKYVDMGVNDFNPLTYQLLGRLLFKTKSLIGRVKVNSTFFSSQGFLFKESELFDSDLIDNIQRFKSEATEVLTQKKYFKYSAERYFTEKGYSEKFLTQYLYPRIQGLYFYPMDGIQNLPVIFVMRFYALQCGFVYKNQPLNIRSNFKGGASSWIKNLVKTIPSHKIHRGQSPRIHKTSHGFGLELEKLTLEVDKIVFACHADEVYKNYKDLLSSKQSAILSKISYAKMISIAHCDRSYLPFPKNHYSAYNCYVKNETSRGHNDYTITYNCNAHQNLPNEAGKDPLEKDMFFVTVNPIKKIEDRFILKDHNGLPLIKEFSRNICDFNLLKAQTRLNTVQGEENLYFVGGYCDGIGLHENCIQQSLNISELIVKLKINTPKKSQKINAEPFYYMG